jgi:hypothetical protein
MAVNCAITCDDKRKADLVRAASAKVAREAKAKREADKLAAEKNAAEAAAIRADHLASAPIRPVDTEREAAKLAAK